MDSTSSDCQVSRLRRPQLFARVAWLAPVFALSLLPAGPAVFAATAARVAPTASFTFSPSNPVVGERVTFTSTSTDPDGDIEDYDWDTDGDGSFDDGDDPVETERYSSPGNVVVRLRVEDSEGDEVTVQRTVTVAVNGPPTAAFTASTTTPDTGQPVALTSTSSDPEGRLTRQDWDLDNDGRFDDASGPTASVTFTRNETRRVSLAVTDSVGAVRTAFRDIVVQNRRPAASFTTSANEVDTGTAITFTSTAVDPDGQVTARRWDFNGDGITDATGVTATRSFADNGTPTVTHSVTDDDGGIGSTSRQITIRNRGPTAAFGVDATEVDTGTPITFTSSSTDPDGTVASHAWDFDGNGTADAFGQTVSHSFGDDGTPTVTLLVTDDDGATKTAVRQLTIRNRAPSAAFTVSPESPVAGDPVQLTSAATDSDGSVVEQLWDLDGDGAYDDATGPQVSTVFAEEGPHTVGLAVTDDDAAAGIPVTRTLEVAARPPPPPDGGTTQPSAGFPPAVGNGPAAPKPTLVRPRLLNPFPLVRVRGITTRSGARLDLLSVRTLSGTRIIVRCKGEGCPWRRKTKVARWGVGRFRAVVIPGFKRRHLRAGTVLEVFVTKPGMIGKYTRFKIRRLKAPLRVDSCTRPGLARPRRCPA